MGLKIKSRFLVFILVILTAISMLLTAFIVLRPVEIFSPNVDPQNVTSNNSDSSAQTRANYLLEDVFRPTRFIYAHENQLRMTSNAEVLQSINQSLTGTIQDLVKEEEMSSAEYEQLLLRDSYSQLVFDAPVSFQIMTRYFENIPEELKEETFTRIIYRYDNPQEVVLLNDETKQSYGAKSSGNVESVFSQVYTDEKFYLVESYMLKQKQVFMEVNAPRVEQQTYLMEQIPLSFYITQLFSNPSELRNRSDGQTSVYNDNLSQLKMDRTTNVISYYQNRVDDEGLSFSTQLQQSFNQMKRLGGWQLGMSFAHFNPQEKMVEYMRYVGSYPILEDSSESLSQFVMTASGIEKMRVSSLIAQTPIPSLNVTIDLMSGKNLMEEVLGKGITLDSLEDIRIGYAWKLSTQSTQIVEFTPDWYFKMDGEWKKASDVLNATTQTNEDGGEDDGL